MTTPIARAATPGTLVSPPPSLLAMDMPDPASLQPPARDIARLQALLRREPPRPTAHLSSSRIPAGDACLAMLDGFHLPYSRVDHVKGIKTPVLVRAPIGGVRYRSWGKRPMVADCRLVVALEWIAPILKDAGVSEVRYIGTYSYRMARVGRLSLHAYGLAIDIDGMIAGGTEHKVSKNFTRGIGSAGCSPAAPVLNEVACRIKTMGLFREVLTPDSNADHHNHIHLGILPRGVTLAMLPRAIPRRHHHKTRGRKLAGETAPKGDPAPRADAKLAKTDDDRTDHESKSKRHTGDKRHFTHRTAHHGKRATHHDHRATHHDRRTAHRHHRPSHKTASRRHTKVAASRLAKKTKKPRHHRNAERHRHHGRSRHGARHERKLLAQVHR